MSNHALLYWSEVLMVFSLTVDERISLTAKHLIMWYQILTEFQSASIDHAENKLLLIRERERLAPWRSSACLSQHNKH